MDSVVASATSVGGATVPRQLVDLMQRQLELMQEVAERERRAQKQLAAHLIAPVDAVFDLLEQTGVTLRRQAEALETAGRALEETARLVKTQAELFERTIGALREPAEITKTAVGLERGTRKAGGSTASSWPSRTGMSGLALRSGRSGPTALARPRSASYHPGSTSPGCERQHDVRAHRPGTLRKDHRLTELGSRLARRHETDRYASVDATQAPTREIEQELATPGDGCANGRHAAVETAGCPTPGSPGRRRSYG